MKKIFSVLLIGFICSSVFFANPATLELFKYNAARMNGGTMYTYKVSNFKGKNEMLTYIYLAGDNKVEFYKDYSVFGNNLFSGKFEIHKNYFMASPLEGGNPLGDLAIPNSNNYSVMNLDYPNNRIVGDLYSWDKHGKSEFRSFTYDGLTWPCYDMSLFMFDFGLVMRHFIGSKKSTFLIGCTYAGYAWDSDVSFEKDEVVNGILCEKWVIKGRGILAVLQGAKQELWFAKDSPFFHVVQFRNHKFSGYWPKQQYVLVDTNPMSAEQWKNHTAAITDNAKKQFGY